MRYAKAKKTTARDRARRRCFKLVYLLPLFLDVLGVAPLRRGVPVSAFPCLQVSAALGGNWRST